MEMSMEIMKQFLLNENEFHSNFVFSPLSINTLLSIVANGLEAGPTLDTLLSLLGTKTLADLNAKACTDHQLTSLKTDDGPQLSSVNGFWIDKKYRLNPSFEKILETIFKADSSTVDFENKPMETVDKVNTWVLDATKGLIRNLLKYEAVKKETTLILANALYFKGAWDSPFDPSSIRTENFYILNGDVVQVPYMCESDLERGSFASYEGFKVLRIPYENNLNSKKGGAGEVFAMYIFLPNDNDGLLNLLDKISSNPCLLDPQLTELEPTYYIRELKIPKFKFQFKFQLSEIMERLGVRMVKEEMLEALSSDDNIPRPMNDDIDIIHSSCIDVNEHGTEAAAVTYEESMGFSLDSSPRIDIDFVADHPFMFMIREDTLGTPIFLGAVVNPLLE